MFRKCFAFSVLVCACFSLQALAGEAPTGINPQSELSLVNQESDFVLCSEDALAGFQCVPKCPANPAGYQWLSFNCRCDKDKAAGTCTPSGVCHKYTLAGKKVEDANGNVVTANCLCDKVDTAPVDEEPIDPIEGGE